MRPERVLTESPAGFDVLRAVAPVYGLSGANPWRAFIALGFADEAGQECCGLEECRASFEASLREAPQDEPFSSISSTIYPHAEERSGVAKARLEARTTPNAGHSCPASDA